jgi:hypothetical protein
MEADVTAAPIDFGALLNDAKKPHRAFRPLTLALEITDPDVARVLERIPDGMERTAYAQTALRIGVVALEHANGVMDSAAIRDAGQQLMGDLRELLTGRARDLTGEIASTLKQYFDPTTGLLNQRVQALVQKDGDLDRMLRTHVGPEDSVVAKTLAQHLGTDSPIFRMLSPTQADGLKVQMEQTIEAALAEQRTQLLREFSLDNKDSALARLVREVSTLQGDLKTGLSGQIDTLVKEFSTDNEQSLLSRLLGKLQETSAQIDSNLTLDNDQSALARVKRELTQLVQGLVEKNTQFQTDMREAIAALQARRGEAQRGPTHGIPFQDQVGQLLSLEAQRLGDIYDGVGNKTGAIKNCKKGDHVITLGLESPAPDARVAFESKADKAYDAGSALNYLDEAKKNRQAQVGVFVFSRSSAPPDLQPFVRYGNDLLVVWDAEDPSTDVYLKAGYSVARALTVRLAQNGAQTRAAIEEIEAATRAVEKQAGYLDQIKTWAKTIVNNGQNIGDRVEKMREDLTNQVETLDQQVLALKASRPAATTP